MPAQPRPHRLQPVVLGAPGSGIRGRTVRVNSAIGPVPDLHQSAAALQHLPDRQPCRFVGGEGVQRGLQTRPPITPRTIRTPVRRSRSRVSTGTSHAGPEACPQMSTGLDESAGRPRTAASESRQSARRRRWHARAMTCWNGDRWTRALLPRGRRPRRRASTAGSSPPSARTGIYCRPSCPARTPLARNVSFFTTAAAAQAAGFRACRRCRPDAVPGSPEWDVRADVVARAMRLIADGEVERVRRPRSRRPARLLRAPAAPAARRRARRRPAGARPRAARPDRPAAHRDHRCCRWPTSPSRPASPASGSSTTPCARCSRRRPSALRRSRRPAATAAPPAG